MNDDLTEIRELLPVARSKTKGSMDPLYDVIADGEALLNGRPTLANVDAAWVIEALKRSIESR